MRTMLMFLISSVALAAQTAATLDPQQLVAMTPARLAWIRGGALAVTLIGACLVPGFSPYVLRAALPSMPMGFSRCRPRSAPPAWPNASRSSRPMA